MSNSSVSSFEDEGLRDRQNNTLELMFNGSSSENEDEKTQQDSNTIEEEPTDNIQKKDTTSNGANSLDDDSVEEEEAEDDEYKPVDSETEEIPIKYIDTPSSDTALSESENVRETSTSDRSRDKSGRKGVKQKEKKKKKSQISEKALEARQELDEALSRLKGTRSTQKDTLNLAECDEMVRNFRVTMDEAALSDRRSIEQEKPALAKYKMLPQVLAFLQKQHLHEIILDNGLLTAIHGWLEPLPNRCLPSVSLRKSLLEALSSLPIESDHLRESPIGRIIFFFAHRQRESPEIQRIAKELFSRWSRPFLLSNLESDGQIKQGEFIQSEKLFESAPSANTYHSSHNAQMSTQQKKIVQHLSKKSKNK